MRMQMVDAVSKSPTFKRCGLQQVRAMPYDPASRIAHQPEPDAKRTRYASRIGQEFSEEVSGQLNSPSRQEIVCTGLLGSILLLDKLLRPSSDGISHYVNALRL
jgi:hypothetical protein